jgi:sugar phosphate isomerase/epimerase
VVARALPAALTGGERVGLFSSCLPGWDARRVIDVAGALGFEVIEWGAGPDQALEPGHDASSLRFRCDVAGLSVSGVSVQDHAVSAATPRRALVYVRLATRLGARFVRLFAPPYRGGSLASEQRRARAGVDVVVEAAAEAGLTVLVETSPGTLAPSAGLALALVEHQAPDRAGVLFDPGNTVIEGYVNPALALAGLREHLRHVHVKNIAWRKVSGAWVWRYAPLSGGMLAWPEILAALASTGYRHGLSIDHLSAKPTRERLRIESEELRALLALTNNSTQNGGAPSPASD